MNRRHFLASTGGALIPLVSGCLSNPGTVGGLVEVIASDVPPNTTVTSASDERIADISPIQQGLEEAHGGNGTGEVEVTESTYDEVAQALSALPWYDRIEHDSTYISGLYIRYDDEVFVVVLTPFCTGSWLEDAHSDRGEYGWGGCIDRENLSE